MDLKVTFKGNEITLVGNSLKVGDIMPSFTVTNNSLEPVRFEDTSGVRVILAVPSVDTPVCDLEIRTFNKRASELENVKIYTISMDLPFAQARWCGAEGVKNVVTLSDYKDRNFGNSTGTYIKELGLLTRAAFVVGSDNKVTYVEYVAEVADGPKYDDILAAARNTK